MYYPLAYSWGSRKTSWDGAANKKTKKVNKWIRIGVLFQIECRTPIDISYRKTAYWLSLPLLTVLVSRQPMQCQCIDLPLLAVPWLLYSDRPAKYGQWAVYFYRCVWPFLTNLFSLIFVVSTNIEQVIKCPIKMPMTGFKPWSLWCLLQPNHNHWPHFAIFTFEWVKLLSHWAVVVWLSW